jgi:hypothetical protein
MSPFANDPYCYPGTDVLINREDIRHRGILSKFEAQVASAFIPSQLAQILSANLRGL